MFRRLERGVYNLYRSALRTRSNPVLELGRVEIPVEVRRRTPSPLRRKAAAVVAAVVLGGGAFVGGIVYEERREEASAEAELHQAGDVWTETLEEAEAAHIAELEAQGEEVPMDFTERMRFLSERTPQTPAAVRLAENEEAAHDDYSEALEVWAAVND